MHLPYTIHGYRRSGGTKCERALDLFRLHNDFSTIWVCIANVFSAFAIFCTLPRPSRWHGLLLFTSIAIRFPYQLAYLLFRPIDRRTSARWRRREIDATVRGLVLEGFALTSFALGPFAAGSYAAIIAVLDRATGPTDVSTRVAFAMALKLAPLAMHADRRYAIGTTFATALAAFIRASYIPERWWQSRIVLNSRAIGEACIGVASAIEFAYLADVRYMYNHV